MASSESMKVKKRTQTLMKKASELATLCSTDTLLMVMHDDTTSTCHNQNPSVATWPKCPNELLRILKRYTDSRSGSNGRDRKRRKVVVDPTAETRSAQDVKVILAALEEKLSAIDKRKRELEEEERVIRCRAGSSDEGCALLMDGCDLEFGLEDMIRCGGYDWRSCIHDDTVTPMSLMLMDGSDFF